LDTHDDSGLMLCESLMLLLVEKGVISREEAVEAVEGVIEVTREIAETNNSAVISLVPISRLQAIARSMSVAMSPKRGPSTPD
jgi:hypothetical protein